MTSVFPFLFSAFHFLLFPPAPFPLTAFSYSAWQQCDERKAERILARELERRGWAVPELEQRPKADAQKLLIAKRLRAETTMTIAWIARRLQAGTPGCLANCLRTEGR